LFDEELIRRSVSASADFVQGQLGTALLFHSAEEIRTYALESTPAEGQLLEFGVFKGESVNLFARLLKKRLDARLLYGFDAFLGLSENWAGHSYKKLDRFNRNGNPPEVEDNVRLVIGWVDDTLLPFLAEHPGPIALLHIDTDTYSPCRTILTLCRDRLVPGSIVLFDDLLCYPGWEHGEFKALSEILDPDRYEWLAFSGYRGLLRII
jgi:hypothetical protein